MFSDNTFPFSQNHSSEGKDSDYFNRLESSSLVLWDFEYKLR